MRINYRIVEYVNEQNKKEGKGIEIVRCYGADGQIVLPERIAGLSVVRVAPYTFSARKQEETADVLSYELEDQELFAGERNLLAGENIQSVTFPNTVSEIGNYVFYGCRELQYLECSDTLTHIGSGAFTGCSGLRELKVHQFRGKQSCVKEILGELWQRLDVTFLYETAKCRENVAKLVFPEHYEEAVENTPARLLFTQHHGSGNRYRQCFYRKEPDFRKYDELFQVAAVQDKIEVAADLAFARLLYPVELSNRYRKSYENYLTENQTAVVEYLIQKEEMNAIHYLSKRKLWTKEGLEKAIAYAAGAGRPEMLSLLMEEKNRLFPQAVRQKKKYEL